MGRRLILCRYAARTFSSLAVQESIIGGHSPEVARKYYSEHDAREAIGKLPPDPLTENRAQARGADADARLAAKAP